MPLATRKPPSGGGRGNTETSRLFDTILEASTDEDHPDHDDLLDTNGWVVIHEFDPEEDEKKAYSKASALRKTYEEPEWNIRSHKEDDGSFVYARYEGPDSVFAGGVDTSETQDEDETEDTDDVAEAQA